MHPSTEELLKIRDGEPVDARIRAAVDSHPALRAELERLAEARSGLQALPTLVPPPDSWARVLEQTRGRRGPGPRGRRAPWVRRVAVAAAVAAAMLAHGGDSGRRQPSHTPSAVTTTVAPVDDGRDDGPRSAPAVQTHASLVAESARLERVLREMTYQPKLMNAETAFTIGGLEDRIAYVDERLTYARPDGLQPHQAEALWQERVDLMNALVKVRYAHAQQSGF